MGIELQSDWPDKPIESEWPSNAKQSRKSLARVSSIHVVPKRAQSVAHWIPKEETLALGARVWADVATKFSELVVLHLSSTHVAHVDSGALRQILGDGSHRPVGDIAKARLHQPIKEAIESGSVDRAIDAIYEFCLDQIEAQKFEAIGSLMQALDVRSLAVEVMLAPLAITVPVARQIPGRDVYFDRVAGELLRQNREDVHALLAGLGSK